MQAHVAVFKHKDIVQLDNLLAACPATQRKLVISDSLFSMDGAQCCLPGQWKMRER